MFRCRDFDWHLLNTSVGCYCYIFLFDLIGLLFWHLLGGTEENLRNLRHRPVRDLYQASPKYTVWYYRYTGLLCAQSCVWMFSTRITRALHLLLCCPWRFLVLNWNWRWVWRGEKSNVGFLGQSRYGVKCCVRFVPSPPSSEHNCLIWIPCGGMQVACFQHPQLYFFLWLDYFLFFWLCSQTFKTTFGFFWRNTKFTCNSKPRICCSGL